MVLVLGFRRLALVSYSVRHGKYLCWEYLVSQHVNQLVRYVVLKGGGTSFTSTALPHSSFPVSFSPNTLLHPSRLLSPPLLRPTSPAAAFPPTSRLLLPASNGWSSKQQVLAIHNTTPPLAAPSYKQTSLLKRKQK